MRVAVGISGGVDSAVAALLLQAAGHEVHGIMMTLWDGPVSEKPSGGCSSGACYGPDEAFDVTDAEAICAVLGLPLRVFDCAERYREIVLAHFRSEYLAGRTPNPCVLCNPTMKFGLLPALAREEGLAFDAFATGHYARVGWDATSRRHTLLRAADRRRDQSYFLHRLSQDQLAMVRFPLGELKKEDVRRLATEAGLSVSAKPDSQDFYEGDHRELLGVEDRPGPILSGSGRVVGSHKGHWNYTIGQRRGLGVASSHPLYVVAIDAGRNAVIVGGAEDLRSEGLVTSDFHALVEALPERATVKVRSAAGDVPCSLERTDKGVIARFDGPQGAITPGQAAVFYDGEQVLGGGTIERAMRG